MLEDITEPTKPVPFNNPQNEQNLVLLDMPELETVGSIGKVLETYNSTEGLWVPWKIRKYAIDGRVFLESVRDPSVAMWCDLSDERYRWTAEVIRA